VIGRMAGFPGIDVLALGCEPSGLVPPMSKLPNEHERMRDAETLIVGVKAADAGLLRQVADRLAAADSDAWLEGLLRGAAPNPDGVLECAVREALIVAVRVAAGDRSGFTPQRRATCVELWSMLVPRVPTATPLHDALRVVQCEVAAVVPTNQIGSWELLELLGEGAFGCVFAARHRDNRRPAAVKLLRVAGRTESQVQRFQRESRLTAQLQHPAIVQVLDSGVEAHAGLSTPYIAYERIHGRPFAEAMVGRPWQTIVRVFERVAAAVEHAHSRGILHRDLKSPNVLVDDADQPHVLDFGIALSPDEDAPRLTRAGEVLGSLATMSPEQAAGGALDHRTDVHALGAMLFEALTNELPYDFVDLGPARAIVKIASTPARSLRELLPAAPLRLVAVVDKALAFSAEDRYSTVQALRQDLGRLLADRPVAAALPSAWHALRVWARGHRRVATGALLAAAALVVSSIAVTFAWQSSLAAKAAESERVLGCRQALQVVVRMMRPEVEQAPTRGEAFDALAAGLAAAVEQAEHGLSDGGAASLAVLASVHELAGDLAHRGKQAARCREHRDRAVELWQCVTASLPQHEVDQARALVKIGDIAPDLADDCYQQAHDVFVAAAADGDLMACDEVGWSLERLGARAFRRGDCDTAFALARQRLDLAEQLCSRQPDALRHFQLASACANLVVFSRERPAKSPFAVAGVVELARRGSVAAEAAWRQDTQRRPFLDLALRCHLYLARSQPTISAVEAQAAATRAGEFANILERQDPQGVEALELAVWTHQEVAELAFGQGNAATAATELRTAADICERALRCGCRCAIPRTLPGELRSAAANVSGGGSLRPLQAR
jgi:predicted Ser/Thr protein kinase